MNPFTSAQGMYITSCIWRQWWLIQLNAYLNSYSEILSQPLWQVPTASVAIEGASALNRVRWAQAGKEVAVGDSEGRIWVYDVGEVHIFWFGVFMGFFPFHLYITLKIWWNYWACLAGQKLSWVCLQIFMTSVRVWGDFLGS